MAGTLATVAELEARLGRPLSGEPERAQADAAVQDASEMVRAYGDPRWGLAETPVPGAVKSVVLAMAERRIRNPDGFTSEQAGEYSYRYSEGGASGFAPSKGEVALLEKLARKTRLHSTPVDRAVGITRRRFYPYEPNDNPVWGPSDGASLWYGG